MEHGEKEVNGGLAYRAHEGHGQRGLRVKAANICFPGRVMASSSLGTDGPAELLGKELAQSLEKQEYDPMARL